jgi:hypothetical protein
MYYVNEEELGEAIFFGIGSSIQKLHRLLYAKTVSASFDFLQGAIFKCLLSKALCEEPQES